MLLFYVLFLFFELILLFFIIVKYLLCLIFKTNNFINLVLKRLYDITSFDLLIGFILIILIIFYLYMFFPVAVAQAPPN